MSSASRPTTSFVLVVLDQVAIYPESIRLFIAALEQGTRDALRDPDAATDAVLAAGEGLDPNLTAAEIEATLPLLMPESDRPYGHMNEREWDEFAVFLAAEGVISVLPEIDDVLTNDLLPGEIPE